MPGVTFTVSALTTNSSISITTDTSAISAAVNSLVSAANSALTFIGQVTAKGQTLQGDNTINSLTQQVLGVVSAGFGGKSLETAGIDITATGSLTFDADAFATAYGADPTGVQTMVQNGFGAGMSAVGTQATDPTTGNLTQLINNDNTQITNLNTEISDWSTKLADQQASLQAKYAAMTATIAKLQSQSTYLTQMFNSISGNNSSSSSSSS
jgi:flagellar hook-associated protein 2